MVKLNLTVFFLLPFFLFGQNELILNSDRPGICNNPNTAGKGVILHQIGYQFNQTNNYAADYNMYSKDQHILISNLRIGLTENFELNWKIGFLDNKTSSSLPNDDPRRGFIFALNENTTGINLNEFGARFTFLRGNGWKPTLGIYTGINTTLLSNSYKYQYSTFFTKNPVKASGSVLLLSHFSYDNKMFWGITTGITEIGQQNTINYAINIGRNFAKKFSFFIEYYGTLSAQNNLVDNHIHGLDGGFNYLVFKNMALDISGGYSFQLFSDNNFSNRNQGFFASFGITWGIRAWNK